MLASLLSLINIKSSFFYYLYLYLSLVLGATPSHDQGLLLVLTQASVLMGLKEQYGSGD